MGTQKTNRIQQRESKQENKYIDLIEKLVQSSASELAKFPETTEKSLPWSMRRIKKT